MAASIREKGTISIVVVVVVVVCVFLCVLLLGGFKFRIVSQVLIEGFYF